MMTLLHTFIEGFCCLIPCPIGLMLLGIPPVVLTLRRRNAARQCAQQVVVTAPMKQEETCVVT